MALDILRAVGPAVAFHVGAARIDRPRRIRDLASREILIIRLAEPDCNIGLALGEIEKPVADDEFDTQARIPLVKFVDERCSLEAVREDRSAGHPNRPSEVLVVCSFPEFNEFKRRARNEQIGPAAEPVGSTVEPPQKLATPDEVLRSTIADIDAALSSELLDRIQASPPSFFESLIVALFTAPHRRVTSDFVRCEYFGKGCRAGGCKG
jgi:hypothetical protein